MMAVIIHEMMILNCQFCFPPVDTFFNAIKITRPDCYEWPTCWRQYNIAFMYDNSAKATNF